MASTKKPVAAAGPAKKNTTPIIIGVIASVVLIVVIVVVVALAGGGDDGDSPFAEGATIREFQGVEVVPEDASLPLATDGAQDPAVGMDSPGLVGASFDGTPVTVTPGDGKPYMLVFLAHWCQFCNAEVPRLVEWYEDGSVPEGLEVVGIATGSDSTRQNFPPSEWLMIDNDWPFAAMADSPQSVASETFGLNAFPFIVMVDEEGKVALRTSGEKGKDVIDQMVDDTFGFTPEDDMGPPSDTTAP
jgi:thiol-disulfide isomerase/thioredoxin